MRRPDPERAPRILAGRFRGRRLLVPDGKVTRPVRALVRRSLFDSLQGELAAAHWLDLYAGSGAFGIEALSRGAAHATFVEAGKEGLRCLRENLARLEIAEPDAVVLAVELPQALDGPPPVGAPFHLISLDPPFAVMRSGDARGGLTEGLERAAGHGWFSADALLLWEEPSDAPAPVPRGFLEEERRGYGTSRVRRLRLRR